jgi:hypothetical protein
MKPKQKAKELVRSMFQPPLDSLEYKQGQKHFFNQYSAAKPCALIAVEFAKENPLNTDGYNKYLEEVKQEIEKL